MDLYQEITRLSRELTAAIDQLRNDGRAYAEAERDYKMALSKKALELRADGTAVTMINLIIYGQREVADKRIKRDIAKVLYDATTEFINITKLKLRLLEAQLSREWGA